MCYGYKFVRDKEFHSLVPLPMVQGEYYGYNYQFWVTMSSRPACMVYNIESTRLACRETLCEHENGGIETSGGVQHTLNNHYNI